MAASLRLVPTIDDLSADTLFDAAMQALPGATPPDQLMARAEALAADTVALIRRDREPGVLASVALVIPDQALRVAYLEAVAARLI